MHLWDCLCSVDDDDDGSQDAEDENEHDDGGAGGEKDCLAHHADDTLYYYDIHNISNTTYPRLILDLYVWCVFVCDVRVMLNAQITATFDF